MTEVQSVLAYNIKKCRKTKGLTQEQLAEKAQTSTNYLGSIETGKKYPSPQMIDKLAKALDINPLELFKKESPNIQSIKRSLEEKIQEVLNDVLKKLELVTWTSSNF